MLSRSLGAKAVNLSRVAPRVVIRPRLSFSSVAATVEKYRDQLAFKVYEDVDEYQTAVKTFKGSADAEGLAELAKLQKDFAYTASPFLRDLPDGKVAALYHRAHSLGYMPVIGGPLSATPSADAKNVWNQIIAHKDLTFLQANKQMHRLHQRILWLRAGSDEKKYAALVQEEMAKYEKQRAELERNTPAGSAQDALRAHIQDEFTKNGAGELRVFLFKLPKDHQFDGAKDEAATKARAELVRQGFPPGPIHFVHQHEAEKTTGEEDYTDNKLDEIPVTANPAYNGIKGWVKLDDEVEVQPQPNLDMPPVVLKGRVAPRLYNTFGKMVKPFYGIYPLVGLTAAAVVSKELIVMDYMMLLPVSYVLALTIIWVNGQDGIAKFFHEQTQEYTQKRVEPFQLRLRLFDEIIKVCDSLVARFPFEVQAAHAELQAVAAESRYKSLKLKHEARNSVEARLRALYNAEQQHLQAATGRFLSNLAPFLQSEFQKDPKAYNEALSLAIASIDNPEARQKLDPLQEPVLRVLSKYLESAEGSVQSSLKDAVKKPVPSNL